jgi:hypothetical protein
MLMSEKQSVECELAGETEALGENLPHANLFTTNPGSNPATNRLSYGTVWCEG